MAYTVWFLQNGRVGSRADREFLEQERGRRRFAKMSDALHSYCFEPGFAEGQEDEEAKFFAPRDNVAAI